MEALSLPSMLPPFLSLIHSYLHSLLPAFIQRLRVISFVVIFSIIKRN